MRYTDWYKVIFYKECSPLVPDPVVEPSSCIPYNNVVHNYHIGSHLISNGWTRCYYEEYGVATTIISIMTQCPMGDDVRLFFGALSTSASTFAYIGAYGPSSVVSQITGDVYAAEIPLLLQGTGYNVYWYNYYRNSIGFSPIQDVALTENFGGDDYDKTSGDTINDRLSWSTDPGWGGYRAVCMNSFCIFCRSGRI